MSKIMTQGEKSTGDTGKQTFAGAELTGHIKGFLSQALILLLSALVGSLVVFGLLRLLGGDVAYILLGKAATQVTVDALRLELGLDRAWYIQYIEWIAGFFTGDLGSSFSGSYRIFDQISTRLVPTLLLAVGSLVLSISLALVLGTFAALNAQNALGVAIDIISQIGTAVPAFWAGLILVVIFAVGFGWFPAGGYVPIQEDFLGSLKSLFLPIIALSLGITSVTTRFVRSAMLDVLNEEYIRTAMAKGRTRRSAVFFHGLRNASIPVVTVGALQLGNLLAGTIVIESVFVIPGLGRLLLTAVQGREVIVVQSVVLVILMIILTMNFLLDILYGLLDPRIADKRRGAGNGRP
jgi:peptide/nickel transport system permease protein